MDTAQSIIRVLQAGLGVHPSGFSQRVYYQPSPAASTAAWEHPPN